MDGKDIGRRLGAMYLRKSQADLEKERIGKFETLAKHRAELTALARRMGLAVDEVFEEIVSGESIEARTEFKKLMEGVGQRRYEYVICHAVDRLGRGDMMEYGWVLSTFQYSHTLIVTPGKTYDPSDTLDLQQLQLQMFFSNAEYMRIKERFRAGIEASVRSGQYISSNPPYGYDKMVTADRKKTITPNKDAVVVKEMYKRIAGGETAGEVARDLNRRGIPTSSGKEWMIDSVKQKIANPAYKGCVQWFKRVRVVDGRDGMALCKKVVESDDPIIAKGLHEPLVSEELWQQANDAITGEARCKKGTPLKNPLAGVLVCAKCGMTMVRTATTMKSGITHSYIRHRCYSTCQCRPSPFDDVMGMVIEELAAVADDYEARYIDGDDGVTDHELRLRHLISERASAERKRNRLIELYMLEKIGPDEFGDMRAPLDSQLERLADAIEEEMAFEPRNTLNIAISIRDAINMLADDGIPAETRNTAIKSIIDRIEYRKDTDDAELELDVYIK